MEYIPSFRDSLHADIQPSFTHSFRDEHDDKMMYGLPKAKKFPMPDAKHVRSAIRFFNYAKPSQERELATNILARMNDYGIDPNDINVGDDNRFKKYLQHSYLAHHGVKGMKWGVRRYQNQDGSYTPAGKRRYNKLADRGDKLRKQGVSTDDTIALPSKLKPLMFIPGVNLTAMSMDIQNRQAINASIQREFDTKMKKVREENRREDKRQAKLDKARTDAYRKVFGKDKVNYMDIYKEMNADLSVEDNDYYKDIERAWRKKHGFKPLSEIR